MNELVEVEDVMLL
jgi:hypothetical protein